MMAAQDRAMLGKSSDPTLDRIYHEDQMLAARTANFLAANAFLAIAFATLVIGNPAGKPLTPVAEIAVIGFGLFLAYFQMAIGYRTSIAIQLWREYGKSGAKEIDDGVLFRFYQDGEAEVNGGKIGPRAQRNQPGKPGSVYGSIPWKFSATRSTNQVVGVVFPLAVAAFWVALSFTPQILDIHHLPTLGVGILVITAFFFIQFLASAPKYPQWYGKAEAPGNQPTKQAAQ